MLNYFRMFSMVNKLRNKQTKQTNFLLTPQRASYSVYSITWPEAFMCHVLKWQPFICISMCEKASFFPLVYCVCESAVYEIVFSVFPPRESQTKSRL